MNLVTLKGLETIAEREFEEQADKWVWAIAKREGVGFDELRPYLVSLRHEPGYQLEAVFVIPGHTAIKLVSDYMCYSDSGKRVAKLEDGKLVGDYEWCALRTYYTGSVGFHGVENLGHALLLARWAHEQDARAKWK